ncbi:MAG: prolyl oligopeptidase family serine peptidase, partial [Alphaproteobacteria bacterium]|nr:prolyl oligopeptidase family serine peptidase [Alphaproteobacteria bacterium]
QLMRRRPEIQGFISIAPPASQYDFSFLAPCPASGMIIHGDKDEVIPQSSVDKLAQKLQKQKNITIDYRTIEGSDHFFSDHLDPLNGHIEDYLDKTLPAKAA